MLNIQNRIVVAENSSNNQLFLRLFDSQDFPLFYAIYGDTEMMAFIGQPLSQAKARKYFQQALKAQQSSQPRFLTFVIVDVVSSEPQGVVGLEWHSANKRSEVEIGVMVLPQWRRQKVAHNAKKLLMDYAFRNLGVSIILANCSIHNAAANLANEQLGFVLHANSETQKSHNMRSWHMSFNQWQCLKSK